MVPGISEGRGTFSDFWLFVPNQGDPGSRDTRNALSLARALCPQAPGLWIPLMLHILCLPNFWNWDKKLIQHMVDGAYNVIIGEPGGLEGFYRRLSTATYERAKDRKKKEIPIYDFLGKSIWQPPDYNSASPHVAFACRAIESIGAAFHRGMSKKVQEECNVSVLCHLVSMSASGKPRSIIYAADRDSSALALLAEAMGLNEADQNLGRTYIQLRNAFSQQQRLSLGWMKDQLIACEHKTRYSSDVSILHVLIFHFGSST